MALNKFLIVTSAVLSIAVPTAGWCAVTYETIPAAYKTIAAKTTNGGNCLAFLSKDLGIKFPPVDLTYLTAKRGIMNVTGTPHVGDVAIINTPGKYVLNGHVALVISVTTTSISILEAHYAGNTVTVRKAVGKNLMDAQSQLGVLGFYRPR
jgi:hypothetical protein